MTIGENILNETQQRAMEQRSAKRRKPVEQTIGEQIYQEERNKKFADRMERSINYFPNLGQEWTDQRKKTEEKYQAGKITDIERGLLNVGAPSGNIDTLISPPLDLMSEADKTLFGGLGGEALGFVGKSITEGDPRTLAPALAFFNVGLKEYGEWAKENPRAAESFEAFVNIAGMGSSKRVVKGAINNPAANIKTLLKGFYGAGVGAAGKGIAALQGLASAIPTALINTFSPTAVAFERVTGLPRGKIRDVSETHEYKNKKWVPRPRGDRIGAAKAMQNIAIQRGAEPGTTAVAKSPLGVADTIELIPAPNKEAVSQQLFSKGVNVNYYVPEAVQKKHLDHVYKVWGFNKNNTDIQIKNPEGPVSGLTYEARLGQSSTVPRAAPLKALDQKTVTLVSKKNPKDNIEAKGLSEWAETLKTPIKVEKLKKEDIKSYYGYLNEQLKKAGEKKRFRLEDNDDGFLHISDSHGSREKELGGVNDMISIHPESGDVFVTISDAHDMFGFNPVGGRGLVAITPPQRSNFKNYAEDDSLRTTVANLGKQIKNIDNRIIELKKELTPVPRTKKGTQAGKKTKAYEEWEEKNKEKLDQIKNKESAKTRFNTLINNTKDKYTVFDKTDNLNKEKILDKMEEKAASFEKEFGIPRKKNENAVTYTMRALDLIDPKANIKDYGNVARRASMLTSSAQLLSQEQTY